MLSPPPANLKSLPSMHFYILISLKILRDILQLIYSPTALTISGLIANLIVCTYLDSTHT